MDIGDCGGGGPDPVLRLAPCLRAASMLGALRNGTSLAGGSLARGFLCGDSRARAALGSRRGDMARGGGARLALFCAGSES